MKLSIIIPIYNGESYLEECLNSIISEIDEEIELLLLDDGSKDQSYRIVQKYKKNNIRVFHHENHGVSYTRNRGIIEAKGDYIMFADSDDKLSSGWKTSVMKNCTGKADVIYYSKDFSDFSRKIEKIDIIHSIFGIIDDNSLGNMSSPWSKLYRREFLLKSQIKFDKELINGEDGIFNLKVILQSVKYRCCGESFYQYRIYTGSSSRQYSDQFFCSNLKYFSLAEALLKAGELKEHEIRRCMSYAVTYSIYLYLFLVSTLSENKLKEKALSQIRRPELQGYIKKYKKSLDCNKGVQIIYWLVQHNCTLLAERIVGLRNTVRKKQKREIQWVEI